MIYLPIIMLKLVVYVKLIGIALWTILLETFWPFFAGNYWTEHL